MGAVISQDPTLLHRIDWFPDRHVIQPGPIRALLENFDLVSPRPPPPTPRSRLWNFQQPTRHKPTEGKGGSEATTYDQGAAWAISMSSAYWAVSSWFHLARGSPPFLLTPLLCLAPTIIQRVPNICPGDGSQAGGGCAHWMAQGSAEARLRSRQPHSYWTICGCVADGHPRVSGPYPHTAQGQGPSSLVHCTSNCAWHTEGLHCLFVKRMKGWIH